MIKNPDHTSSWIQSFINGNRLDMQDLRCSLIAEIAQAHDGSLGMAHAFIDAVSATGADAIKFQTHIADAESTPEEPWRVEFSYQDASRYNYWKRMEFTEEQWIGLAKHAQKKNLIFLSTPFSFEAFELLNRIGVPAWKVGSGDITNIPLIEKMSQTNKPVLLSSGMATWDELDLAVNTVRSQRTSVAVFQCTTSYPCTPEKLGLNLISEIRNRYSCAVGLSDHSGTIFSGLAAASLGAKMLEVHVTFSRDCFGPDVSSSITIEELSELAVGIEFINEAMSNPVKMDENASDLSEVKSIFSKSIVAARDIPKGILLSRSDLHLRKPGTGLSPSRLSEFIGRRTVNVLKKGEQISEASIE